MSYWVNPRISALRESSSEYLARCRFIKIDEYEPRELVVVYKNGVSLRTEPSCTSRKICTFVQGRTLSITGMLYRDNISWAVIPIVRTEGFYWGFAVCYDHEAKYACMKLTKQPSQNLPSPTPRSPTPPPSPPSIGSSFLRGMLQALGSDSKKDSPRREDLSARLDTLKLEQMRLERAAIMANGDPIGYDSIYNPQDLVNVKREIEELENK